MKRNVAIQFNALQKLEPVLVNSLYQGRWWKFLVFRLENSEEIEFGMAVFLTNRTKLRFCLARKKAQS